MDWKKISLIALDIVIGGYLILAVTAFNKPDDADNTCHDMNISITQDTAEGFLNESDIERILRRSGISLISKPMRTINTRQIEELLEGHDLIDSVECYKSINGIICVKVSQRTPVVRVMAQNGDDYYVDNHGNIIQHNNYSCNLLVATGNISKKYASKVLAPIVSMIDDNPFWKNQIVQLNVLDDHSLEIVPRVGDHIAYLGQPDHIADKLDRLSKFYKYGLTKAGWNRYSRISVEFDNQIICKKKK